MKIISSKRKKLRSPIPRKTIVQIGDLRDEGVRGGRVLPPGTAAVSGAPDAEATPTRRDSRRANQSR